MHESSTERLDSYCVEKKEAPESTDSENEEAPHGGERGFLGSMREPGDGVGAPSRYSLYAFYRLSVSGVLSHKPALKPISRDVSLL